jgi:hypothetical protein
MKRKSRKCKENLELIEYEKGRLFGNDQKNAKARKKKLRHNKDESKVLI